MKYTRIIVTHYGGPEAIRIIEEECPEPKKGEVRVRVLAAGVSMPDVMAREGVHPETPRVPYTPGWDLVGVVDSTGNGAAEFQPGRLVAAMPIHGAYAEFICLPENELIPVPRGLDAAEAVSVVLNYITAYQMLHRSAKVKQGQRVLIHGASGGVGTAILQLGHLAGLEMYGTCSPQNASTVLQLGATPIDYHRKDIAKEILARTGDGVDAVFDPIGGKHIWDSRKALHRGGKVVVYGTTTSLRGGLSARRSRRHRSHGMGIIGWYIVRSWLLPGQKRVVPYSIQTLKRLKPTMFREDLLTLFEFLKQEKIRPLIAHKFPLVEARQAQELLQKGGVAGKIVLIPGY